jgi:NSS family neurotransmitter:Na+ symporter
LASLALCTLSLLWHFDIEALELKNISFFEVFDYGTANILMPLGGLMTCIFAAWWMRPSLMRDEITNNGTLRGRFFPVLLFTLRYITPLLIIYIFLKNLNII